MEKDHVSKVADEIYRKIFEDLMEDREYDEEENDYEEEKVIYQVTNEKGEVIATLKK